VSGVPRRISSARIVAVLVLILLGAAACGDAPNPPPGAGPTSPAVPVEPAAPAGPAVPVGPQLKACAGVRVTPADDVQAAIDAHPPGTTFCLAAGTYRLEAPLVPRQGDALVGQVGAVLSGAKVLSGWQADGQQWTTTGFLPAAPETSEWCLDTAPLCSNLEDVFLDGQRLQPVESASAVKPGSFFADYATNTIVIADDPAAHLVEQAVASSLVQGTAKDVTVANLVLQQAANDAQLGAVESRQDDPAASGSGWRVLNNVIRLNHGVGVGVADASSIIGNVISDQGQLGIGVWGTGSVLTDNEIAFNGVAGYSSEWEAGGVKAWMTERLTLSRNYVHDNLGPGLWADGGNIDTTYTHNRITNNWNAGIQHEISYDATITYNDIAGNGRRHKGWAWDAGIQIQSSGGINRIEVAHNTVSDNANGVTLIDSGDRATEDPAPHGEHRVQNVWVHDNTITMAAGQSTGAVEDTGNQAIFTSNGNLFEGNTYRLPSLTEPLFVWDGLDVGWETWRDIGSGTDQTGRANVLGG